MQSNGVYLFTDFINSEIWMLFTLTLFFITYKRYNDKQTETKMKINLEALTDYCKYYITENLPNVLAVTFTAASAGYSGNRTN